MFQSLIKWIINPFLPKYYDDIDDFREDKWMIETLDGQSVPITVNIRIYELIYIPNKREEMIECLINAVYQNYVRGDVSQEQMIRLEKELKDKTNKWIWSYSSVHKIRQEKIKRK